MRAAEQAGTIQELNVYVTKIANDTAGALARIVAGIEEAAVLVGGIAESSSEQASEITQVKQGIEQVSQSVRKNSSTAEKGAAASEELSCQAELLKEMAGRFEAGRGNLALPNGNQMLEVI